MLGVPFKADFYFHYSSVRETNTTLAGLSVENRNGKGLTRTLQDYKVDLSSVG